MDEQQTKVLQINQILNKNGFTIQLNNDLSNLEKVGQVVSSEIINCHEKISGKLKENYKEQKAELSQRVKELTTANNLINSLYN